MQSDERGDIRAKKQVETYSSQLTSKHKKERARKPAFNRPRIGINTSRS